MLQHIRDNSQGWIAKTIVGLIIVLMTFTGIDAIFNGDRSRQKVAEVNGEVIDQAQLTRAISMQRAQFAQQLGGGFDSSLLQDAFLRAPALNSLIERILLLQSARAAGFAYSGRALDQVILQTPEFQVDGKFSADRFDQVIRNMGYGRLEFRQLLEQEMLIGQLRAGIMGSAFATDPQVQAFARLDRQTRDFSMHLFRADPEAITLPADAVQQYYSEHKAQFRSPEQVVVSYIELKKDRFFNQVSVDEQQLKALYEQQVAALGEQRRAAHILIRVDDQTSDGQARKKIGEIRSELDQGADFATLARKDSQDKGSASEGGDLGFAGPGVYDPAFEKALFALQEGQVSAPVRTAFGWHLIRLEAVKAPEIPSFDSLRPELERQLKAAEVEQLFVSAVKQLDAAAYEAANLVQPASEFGLKIQTSVPFARTGAEQGIAANPGVIQAAFSDPVLVDGTNSGVIELDPETAVVLHLKEHREPETLPLEQVQEQIARQLRQEKATGQARQAAEAALASLQKPAAEGGASLEWQTVEAAGRHQEGIDPLVLGQVFRMPAVQKAGPASYASVALGDGSIAVVRLEGVAEPAEALTDAQKLEYRRLLASREGQQAFSAFMERVRAAADIER